MTKKSSAKIPRYRNPAAPVRRRVDAWLSRMTLEEKAAQMVQMYVRDCVSSVTRPVRKLKGFQKISLQPGETQTVALEITPESLAFWDVKMKYVVEPGEFEIKVGNSPRDCDLQKPILMLTR